MYRCGFISYQFRCIKVKCLHKVIGRKSAASIFYQTGDRSFLTWENSSDLRMWTRLKIIYTTFTNFSMKYLVLCKVYTHVDGIKLLYHVCPPIRKIIHSLKLVDFLHVQADNPWYNYYINVHEGHLKCKVHLKTFSGNVNYST